MTTCLPASPGSRSHAFSRSAAGNCRHAILKLVGLPCPHQLPTLFISPRNGSITCAAIRKGARRPSWPVETPSTPSEIVSSSVGPDVLNLISDTNVSDGEL